MPVFGGENEESDMRAVALMQQWNPGESHSGLCERHFDRRREYPLHHTADPGGKKIRSMML